MKTKKIGALIISAALAVGSLPSLVLAEEAGAFSEYSEAVTKFENKSAVLKTAATSHSGNVQISQKLSVFRAAVPNAPLAVPNYDGATEVDSYFELETTISNAQSRETIVLTSDVEYPFTSSYLSGISISGKEITIVLNGHTLNGGFDSIPARNSLISEGNHFVIGSGAKLTLAGPGKVTGFCGQDGGAFDNRGTLVIENGVEISGNYAIYGGGINNSGDLTIHDSAIIDNQIWDKGGGVLFGSGEVKLGGSTVISGNVNVVDNKESNLLLYDDCAFVVDQAFTEGACIGVETTTGAVDGIGTFADGVENTIDPFVSDNGAMMIDFSDDGSVRARDMNWADLQSMCNEGGTIVLERDFTAGPDDKVLSISGKDVTLDLNGHTLDRGLLNQAYAVKWDNGCISVENGGSLTIRDSSSDHSGKITGANGTAAIYADNSYIKLESGTICGNSNIARSVDEMSHVSGAVNVVGSTFEMTGGIIKENKAAVGGGVSLADGSRFIMSGGEISSNHAYQGGAVFIYGPEEGKDACLFEMRGGKISNNEADYTGGGICAMGSDDVEYSSLWERSKLVILNGGSIESNKAMVGGGVLVQDASLEMNEGAVIKKNNATGYSNLIDFYGQEFYDVRGGGGIHCRYGLFFMNGGTITENTTGNTGGGLELGAANAYISGGSITKNTCNFDGSGIYVDIGELHLSGGSVTGNIVETTQEVLNDYHIAGAVSFPSNDIYIQGDPVVKDNKYKVKDFEEMNVDILIASQEFFVIEGELEDDAELHFYPGGFDGAPVTKGAAKYCAGDPLDIFKCNDSTQDPNSSDDYYYFTSALNTQGEVCTGFPAFITIDMPGSPVITAVAGMKNFPLPSLPQGETNEQVIYGWTLNGKEYTGGDAISIPEATSTPKPGGSGEVLITPPRLTLGVIWGNPSYWTVGFDKGNSRASGMLNPIRVEKGESYIIPECGFEAPSYMTFDKWKIGNTYYEPGESYVPENDEFTLVAQWEALGPMAEIQCRILEAEDNVKTTIVLDSDAIASSSDSALIIPLGKDIVLDLNGHTIDRGLNKNSGVKEACIIVKGSLTITDSAGGGKITGGNSSGIVVGDGMNASSLTLNGGSIDGNYTASNGGGVICKNRATFTMSDGAITGNTASGNGGGVYCESGSNMTMLAGSISGNNANNGGGVHCYQNSNLTMKGGVISGNHASNNAGGVYMFRNATTFSVMGASVVDGNTSGNNNTPNNLYTNKITVSGALTEDAKISVMNLPVHDNMLDADRNSYTVGLSGRGTLANFSSDLDEFFFILTSEGEAKLVPQPAKLEGYSLTLDGSIGVNFYVSLPDELASDPTTRMRFTVGSDAPFEVSVNADTVTVGDVKYYIFTCPIAARKMNDEIIAQLFVGDEPVSEASSFTVKSYADYIIANETKFGAKAVDLAKAMLNYGYFSQKYLNYKFDTAVPVDGYTMNVSASDWRENAEFDSSKLPEGVSVASSNLTLVSETRLCIQFVIPSDMDVEFYLDGETEPLETVPYGANQEYTRVIIPNIPAQKLKDDFKINILVDGVDNGNCIVFSPSIYCYKALTVAGVSENLPDLVKALYCYYDAAKSYSEQNG